MTKTLAKRSRGPTARKGKRDLAPHDRDTEQRILAAARQVFIRRGTAGARMQEIAAEAEVNQALLHYYFRSKQALALAVFREAAGRLLPGLLGILTSDAPLEKRITGVVHHYIDTLREHPFLPGYVLAEAAFHPDRIPALAREVTASLSTKPEQLVARLDAELARLAATGVLRPMRAEQLIANVAALCVFPFAARPMLHHLLGVGDWDRFLDERRRDLPAVILATLAP